MTVLQVQSFSIAIYSVDATREILTVKATRNFKTKYFRCGRGKNRSVVNSKNPNSKFGFDCFNMSCSIARITDKKSQLF